MAIDVIDYLESVQEYEYPLPYSMKKPGFNIDGTRLVKYIEEEGVTEAVIPDFVTEIGRGCFKNCRHLKSIIIPDSVMLICAGAFKDCFSLESIRLPAVMTAIGDSLFQNCYMLHEIDIPKGVRYIGYTAFQNCHSLKKISLPDGLKLIEQYAFESCTDLTEIILPDGVNLHSGVFKDCTSLEKAELPKDIVRFFHELFYGCTALREVVIPETVKEIQSETFYMCKRLRYIRLPDSLEEIGNSAFEGSGLESIDFPAELKKIGDKAFYHCRKLFGIHMPPGLISVGYKAFDQTEFIYKIKEDYIRSENHILLKHKPGEQIVTIPGDILMIGAGVFRDDDIIKHVVFPNRLHDINNDAFNGCIRLDSVFIPYSVKNIGEGAFRNCCSITDLEFSDGIETIGHWAFKGCSSLTEVKFPESLDELGDAAFENCTSLKKVIFPENKIIDFLPSTFFGCDFLTTMQIGKHRFKIDKPEKVCEIYNTVVRLLIEKNFEYRPHDRKHMIPLIVQIYIDSGMSEAEKYIKDNSKTVLRNLSYNGEYTLVESLLAFSEFFDLNKLGEMKNYFHERNDEKMIKIIQEKIDSIHFLMDWENFFDSQDNDE